MQGRKWHLLHFHKLVEAYDGHTSLYAGGAVCFIAQETESHSNKNNIIPRCCQGSSQKGAETC